MDEPVKSLPRMLPKRCYPQVLWCHIHSKRGGKPTLGTEHHAIKAGLRPPPPVPRTPQGTKFQTTKAIVVQSIDRCLLSTII